MQNDVFDHNLESKAQRMMILAFRYVFEVKQFDGAICFEPMTLTFQGHDLCEITFWAISQLLMGKMLPNFKTR